MSLDSLLEDIIGEIAIYVWDVNALIRTCKRLNQLLTSGAPLYWGRKMSGMLGVRVPNATYSDYMLMRIYREDEQIMWAIGNNRTDYVALIANVMNEQEIRDTITKYLYKKYIPSIRVLNANLKTTSSPYCGRDFDFLRNAVKMNDPESLDWMVEEFPPSQFILDELLYSAERFRAYSVKNVLITHGAKPGFDPMNWLILNEPVLFNSKVEYNYDNVDPFILGRAYGRWCEQLSGWGISFLKRTNDIAVLEYNPNRYKYESAEERLIRGERLEYITEPPRIIIVDWAGFRIRESNRAVRNGFVMRNKPENRGHCPVFKPNTINRFYVGALYGRGYYDTINDLKKYNVDVSEYKK